jgi:hypothetical protein
LGSDDFGSAEVIQKSIRESADQLRGVLRDEPSPGDVRYLGLARESLLAVTVLLANRFEECSD